MDKWQPHHITEVNKKMLVLPHPHYLYHDIRAISSAIDYAQGLEINTILFPGDLLDFYGLSRFVKDPRKRSIDDEIWSVLNRYNSTSSRLSFNHFFTVASPHLTVITLIPGSSC